MNYSSPAQDWTEKQLQDKQLAELKMHVKGGPCRCNTAYLVSVPCFIDASVLDSLASGGTNLTKSFPCFISPLRGNHTGMQESTSALKFFSFPWPPLLIATKPAEWIFILLYVGFGQILLMPVKKRWSDGDKMPANTSHLRMYSLASDGRILHQAQTLQVDTIGLLRSFFCWL